MVESVSIVISTYNGRRLLERNLPSVLDAAKFYEGETEIILVDDGSSDGSGEFVRKKFPEVRFVELESNIGPLLAINKGFGLSRNRVIILLDNDILAARDFIAPLTRHFVDKDIFGVMPALNLSPDGITPQAAGPFRCGLKFRRGFIETEIMTLPGERQPRPIFLLGGGASAIDREKLMKLGGFDELYSPFYWEDADLSYRAWKRGWKIIYEPNSMVHHESHATIAGSCSRRYVEKISERNRYIIVWKNISDKRMLFLHLLWIPARGIKNIITGRWWCAASFFLACARLGKIISSKKTESREARITDRELFCLFNRKRDR